MSKGLVVVLAIGMTLGIWAVAPILRAQDLRPPTTEQPAVQDKPSAEKPAPGAKKGAPAGAAESRPIVVKDGRLTVRVKDRPLDWVLGEISRLGRVAIGRGGTVGGHLVSVEFEGLPLDEGLRQLLADKADFFLFYGSEPNRTTPASLKAVWVYSRGRGRGLEPVPASEWASTKELRARLADPDPRARADAIQGLIEREGNRAQGEVLQALKDPDGKVRMQALFFAVDAGVTVPPEQLKHLALTDPARDVRVLALQGLAGKPDAREVAEQALNDADPHVRSKAREVLTLLDRASRPQGAKKRHAP